MPLNALSSLELHTVTILQSHDENSHHLPSLILAQAGPSATLPHGAHARLPGTGQGVVFLPKCQQNFTSLHPAWWPGNILGLHFKFRLWLRMPYLEWLEPKAFQILNFSEFWNIFVYNRVILGIGPKPDMNFPYNEHVFYTQPNGNLVQYFWYCILAVTYPIRSEYENFHPYGQAVT